MDPAALARALQASADAGRQVLLEEIHRHACLSERRVSVSVGKLEPPQVGATADEAGDKAEVGQPLLLPAGVEIDQTRLHRQGTADGLGGVIGQV